MLQLNFYPESDKKEYIKAADEYSLIWKKEGIKIIESIENYSGLAFKTKVINAVIFGGDQSYSYPLRLNYNYSFEIKKGILIHELCHRLMLDNNITIKKQPTLAEFTRKIHKRIFLILYDILIELYGEKYAKSHVAQETQYDDLSYKKAWEWALLLSKDERISRFKELVKLRS